MWENPLTVFGNLSIPFLLSNFLTLLGFFVAAYLAIRYTKIFYEGRGAPNSWRFIVAGLLSVSISEIGQFLLSYISIPSQIEGAMTLITFDVGIVLVVWGTYLLYRGVQ
jgi:uncharacterized membrane protein